jgi:hypothetical protein
MIRVGVQAAPLLIGGCRFEGRSRPDGKTLALDILCVLLCAPFVSIKVSGGGVDGGA